jgi:acyl-CoA thioesterase FadM
MSVVTESGAVSLLKDPTTVRLRPRFEGSNIGTWLGFKHINYLVEEAVLEHFRSAGLPVGELYSARGVGLDLVDLDTRIISALHLDDVAEVEVTPKTADDATAIGFTVLMWVTREGTRTKVASSKVKVVLRVDGQAVPTLPLPAELDRFTVARIGAGAAVAEGAPATPVANTSYAIGRGTERDPVLEQLIAGRNAHGWKWRIPYFYCHFTERLQMSGYLRHMEEVVDLFLAERGLSIRHMLDSRGWIPACTRSRIELLDEALMEEELYTVYTVDEIFKDFTYTSSMDCYVVRDGRLVQTATGKVTHGYAAIGDRTNWGLVNFDELVHRALRNQVEPTR